MMTDTDIISTTLQNNLRSAMAAELTTIPTYLYAYWSIKPLNDGGSQAGAQAAQTIMSVIVEEMLHMGLVSNILNSLGGTPALTESPYLPQYPCPLLRPPISEGEIDVEVKLGRLSYDSIKNFLSIEFPEYYDLCSGILTLGQFYEQYIRPELTEDLNYCSRRKQLPTFDNPGVGTLIQVGCQQDALKAVDLIVKQGEGFSNNEHEDGEHELAHFWKFLGVYRAIEQGFLNLDTDVYQVIDAPYEHEYNQEQQEANRAFNSTYSNLLDELQSTFSSNHPEVFYKSTTLMKQLNRQAAVLRNTGGTVPDTDDLPGPTFEYIPAGERVN
ncbi:MAG: hypothetical protein F6J92_12495 [Symploca sp. SIO1A3]|nr:hypothetical protein [Symploca sp. SIO1A3]